MKFKLKNDELRTELIGESKVFPTYVSPILNLANRFSGATRPEVVGQMSELIQKCPYKTFEGWKKWYLAVMPNAIDRATKKIVKKLEEFKNVMDKIDENIVREWVEDLVLVKTFIGLRFQELVLKRIASTLRKNYRLATPDEEAQGIDGFIGDTPVSIKPETYKIEKGRLGEKIAAKIVYYRKTEDGIEFEFEQ
ncbi:MAG: MjaI family restriction endonuclease [Candidatus Bathyarchaeia archaeon]